MVISLNHIALLALLGLVLFAALMIACASQVLAPADPGPAIPAAAAPRQTSPLVIPLGRTTIEFVSIQEQDGNPGTCDTCHFDAPAEHPFQHIAH